MSHHTCDLEETHVTPHTCLMSHHTCDSCHTTHMTHVTPHIRAEARGTRIWVSKEILILWLRYTVQIRAPQTLRGCHTTHMWYICVWHEDFLGGHMCSVTSTLRHGVHVSEFRKKSWYYDSDTRVRYVCPANPARISHYTYVIYVCVTWRFPWWSYVWCDIRGWHTTHTTFEEIFMSWLRSRICVHVRMHDMKSCYICAYKWRETMSNMCIWVTWNHMKYEHMCMHMCICVTWNLSHHTYICVWFERNLQVMTQVSHMGWLLLVGSIKF